MKSNRSFINVIARAVICFIILFFGIFGMISISKLKKDPAQAVLKEKPLLVDVVEARLEDIPVSITGYGEVKALNSVSISSEISGKITYINSRLEPGEIIPSGDILFKIDSRNYKAAYDESRAIVEQLKNTVQRLEKEYEIYKIRLKTLLRSKNLAEDEFNRVKKLFTKNKVGTQSGVDSAEQAYNSAKDRFDQIEQSVLLFPIRIREAKNTLDSSKARLEIAKANLKRCVVKTTFNSRVKDIFIELGQYVTTGMPALTLADDSILEIWVPLDSRDARQWIKFDENKTVNNIAWFNGLEKVKSKIRWTEDPKNHIWIGFVHRVVKFDRKSRTITVAVRINAEDAVSNDNNMLPLVESMFCSVEIPGKILKNVFKLPRWSVSYEKTIFIVDDNRLKTVPVEVERTEEDFSLVSKGINQGDYIIITRLVNPLENSLVKISEKIKK